MRTSVALVMLTIMGLCSGCAMTRQTVPFQGHRAENINRVVETAPRKTISVVSVVDKRQVSEPGHVFHKTNAYGPTTGSFVAERPITDIVKECLTDAMERAGYKMLDSANQLSITTEIQDFDIKLAMGAWSSEAISTLTMKFIIKETTDGKTIWRDTILGKGHAKPKGFDYGQVYSVECFTSSLDDAIRQFVENEEVVDLVK